MSHIEENAVNNEIQKKLTHDHERDRKIALAMLRPMLFQPREDAFSGIMVRTAYELADAEDLVGGDFWDTFAFDHGHVALVVGDVMGHGLDSAIFTTELKHTMRAYIREHVNPHLVLHHMNRFLYQSNRLFREGINTQGGDSPVCIGIAVIDRETGAGAVAKAGMPEALLIRTNNTHEVIATVGMPLGISADEVYGELEFQLEPGDTLIMHTDGITEARRGGEFLDMDGLIRLAIEGNGGDLKKMADTILEGVREFTGGKLKDDEALLLVRRAATSPTLGPRPPHF